MYSVKDIIQDYNSVVKVIDKELPNKIVELMAEL